MSRVRLFAFLMALAIVATAAAPVIAADKVSIELTYPNGRSPKVFTVGWTFGAKAIVDPGTKEAKDVSKQVKWSGTAVFSPSVGSVSHPSFSTVGANTIELSVTVDKKRYTKTFNVQTVKPNHATIGDKAHCPADAHGCPACPHPVVGPITSGNSKVLINGKPVACVGDKGIHAACCGPNTFTIVSGDPNVMVDGKPVARRGDKTQHCGGTGKVVEASFVLGRSFAGSFSGESTGTANFVIEGGQLSGSFLGSHSKDGGGGVNLKLSGTYNPKNGQAKGTMTGTATYPGFDDKTLTAKVTGTFKGLTKGNAFTGTWNVTAKGLETRKASGSFRTIRKGK